MRVVTLLPVILCLMLTAATAAQPTARPEDEKAIRDSAEAFTKAYNVHDAKTLAGLFAADAEIVNEAGERCQGREAIAQAFAAVFEQNPHARISVSLGSLRFVAPSVAIEEGRTTVRGLANDQIEHSRYTVLHVKQDGQWQMASARDLPDEEAQASERLAGLEWLVGDWLHETPDALVVTSYRWDKAHQALLSDFRIQVGGRPAMVGMQRIGWDPATKAVHSWIFDSDGGAAEGVWTRDGGRWIVKMTGATHDGRAVSSTNVITKMAENRMTWQSRDRVVGDEVLPNIDEVVIVRTPPEPAKPAPGAATHSTGASK